MLDRFISSRFKKQIDENDQSLIMIQALSCLYIAAKNIQMDLIVPSSKKFLR